MDRYDDLELDLECDRGGGGVAHKASLFGGMFKKSSKSSADPSLSVHSQDDLSTNSQLSKSNESLSNSNSDKDKTGGFKGAGTKHRSVKDPDQTSLSFANAALSVSVDSLTETKPSKDKALGAPPKPPPRPGHRRRASQDFLDMDHTSSTDNLTETSRTKQESSGTFGMFKKSPKPDRRRPSQDHLSASAELSGSQDSLTVGSSKEGGGMFGGIFKKSPKISSRTQSQDDLSEPRESTKGHNDDSVNKDKGLFSGVFKKPKGHGAKAHSQENLAGELSGSKEELVDNAAKEKGGLLSGVFKKPKLGARSQSKDDLMDDGELSKSQESLSDANTKEKGGLFAGVFKKPKVGAKSESKEDLTAEGELSSSRENLADNNKEKSGFFSGMFKKPKGLGAKSQSQDDLSESSEVSGSSDNLAEKSSKSKFTEAMTKLNPFKSSHKAEESSDSSDDETQEENTKPKDQKKATEEQELMKDNENEEKPKQVRRKVAEFEPRDRSETIMAPNPRHGQDPEGPAERPGRLYPSLNKPDAEALDQDEEADKKTVKVRRPKHHNPFMPRTGAKLAPVETEEEAKDEKGDTPAQEDDKEDEGGDRAEVEAKADKPKRRNPFMPKVKAKTNKKENEGGKTLFDQLEEFRFEPSQPENSDDVENLMEWWNTVDNWEDTPQFDDMTPKEEAKAFAVTAEKIQKGIRVFNKLFSERAESLWQHVIDLNGIADGLDKFNKKTKIAQITGGSTSATGGVLTITGLALAPVTMGTSLIVTAVGLGIATAGGLTSAGAGISNQVNNSMDRKKVEKIVEDYQEKMVDLNKALMFIKQGIENLRQFDLIKMKTHAYNNDFPVLNSRFYEDGAMAGKAILINANEIMRVVQIANVAGSTAARAVQIASMATGVLTGLFVGMDIYFVAKDSKELKKGAKSEFAAKIREVAQQLHDGLVELNTIREELQATTKPESEQEARAGEVEGEKKQVQYDDDEEEDEIDRIKKQMKKDYEDKEWV